MKFSLPVPCNACERVNVVYASGDQSFPDVQCECGAPTYVIDDGLLYKKIYLRATAELAQHDWTMAIILGAMSIEAFLAYTYTKWRSIDDDVLLHEITTAHKELWEAEFKKLRQISDKLDAISKLLTGEDFDIFIAKNSAIQAKLQTTYPALGTGSPKEFFIKELFWRRNNILHSGMVLFGSQEAEECMKVTRSLHEIITAMDSYKYKKRWHSG